MRTSLWPMALLASSVVAAPLAGDVEKRQAALPGQPGAPPIPKQFSLPALLKNPSLLKEIQPLLDSQNKSGSAGRFMGTPEACKFGGVQPHYGLNLTSFQSLL